MVCFTATLYSCKKHDQPFDSADNNFIFLSLCQALSENLQNDLEMPRRRDRTYQNIAGKKNTIFKKWERKGNF
jgi:hypothetical protein